MEVTKMIKTFYFYHDDIKTGLRGEGCGYRFCYVKSIGPKWVKLKFSKHGNFRKLSRKKWEAIKEQRDFETLEEHKARTELKRRCKDAGISFYRRRYGKLVWKSLDELSSELSEKEAANG